jgi:hypothetical protein
MLTIIGRAATLTKGSITLSVIPDSGAGVPAHGTPRFCYYQSACRKIINDGTVALSSSTELTSDNTCPNNLPVCTVK